MRGLRELQQVRAEMQPEQRVLPDQKPQNPEEPRQAHQHARQGSQKPSPQCRRYRLQAPCIPRQKTAQTQPGPQQQTPPQAQAHPPRAAHPHQRRTHHPASNRQSHRRQTHPHQPAQTQKQSAHPADRSQRSPPAPGQYRHRNTCRAADQSPWHEPSPNRPPSKPPQ